MVVPILNRYYFERVLKVLIQSNATMITLHDRVWHIDDVKAILSSKGDVNGRTIRQ